MTARVAPDPADLVRAFVASPPPRFLDVLRNLAFSCGMEEGDFRSEVSIILLRRAESYNPARADVSAWARCIADSTASDVRKKWSRRNAILGESQDAPVDGDLVGEEASFWGEESVPVEDLALERAEQTQRVILFNLIARRVPKVWYLIHQQEIDPQKHLGITPNSWAKRLVALRQRLREVCADLEGGDASEMRARLEREDAQKTSAERAAADVAALYEAVRLHERVLRGADRERTAL